MSVDYDSKREPLWITRPETNQQEENQMRQWLTIVAVALLAASGLQAQNPPPSPWRIGRGGMTDIGSVVPQQIVDQLSLTADQQTKLKDLDAKFIKERDQLLEKQRADGKDIAKLRADMTATRDTGDTTKIEGIHGKIMELFQPQLDLRKKYQDEFKTSLTDQQKNKLDYGLEQMMQGQGGAPPPGGAGK